MKRLLICSLIIALTVLVFINFTQKNTEQSTKNLLELTDADTIEMSVDGNSDAKLELEVARSDKRLQEGLMFRTGMGQDNGMIFIFEEEALHVFWMKNTMLSLDIIYLDSGLRVVSIQADTKTNQTEEVYPSIYPAQYVIEVNAGWAELHNLTVGSQLKVL